MSAPPDRAVARCACTNISLMQLFHELKQKFPGAPDHAVSGAIAAYCHDKRACETHLESQAEASLTHAYHASSSAAARRLKDLREALTPLECRNRPLDTCQFPSTVAVHELPCQKPQKAEFSATPFQENNNTIEPIQEIDEDCPDTDKNDVLVEAHNYAFRQAADSARSPVVGDASPITVNIDNCVVKNSETPSDVESDHLAPSEDEAKLTGAVKEIAESTNYRILKSNKIKSNLNERLEKAKGKKAIAQQVSDSESKVVPLPKEPSPEKPKRPCTLEFMKPQPELNFQQHLTQEQSPEPCRIVSPVPPAPEPLAPTPLKESAPAEAHVWPEYPLNLSVNVNVDIPNRQRAFYPDQWLEEYEPPRAFTSVNLTVCTPTSAMQSPVREAGGFEGHLTVTVSPSTARAPRRPAPPPPAPHVLATPPSSRSQPYTITNAGLLARQRERKAALLAALAKERENLRRVEHEVAVLRAPPPAPAVERRLRDRLDWLRAECQRLVSMQPPPPPTAAARSGQEARRSPAPSRPAPPPPATDEPPKWQCRVCTFENHGELNMCEQCDMLRNIELGTNRSVDSGVGSLSDTRRLSGQIESSLLLGGTEPVERQAGRACV